MNIGFFIENYREGGLDKILYEKLNNWPNNSDNLIIFHNQNYSGKKYIKTINNIKDNLESYKSPYDYLNLNKKSYNNLFFKSLYNTFICYLFMLGEVLHFKKRFKEKKLEAIYIHNGGWPGSRISRSAAIAAKIAGLKNIFIIIHNLPQKKNLFNYLQETILEIILKLLKIKIISVSNSVKSNLESKTMLPKALTIYNGISMPKQNNNLNLRNDLGIQNDEIILSAIGTLEHRRGHNVLFRAIKEIKKSNIKLRLLIAGEGNKQELKRINALMGKYQLGKNVILLGFIKDIASVINISNFVINPVIAYESFGIVSLECMALKKLMISSNIGGVPEVIINNKTGILFKTGDHTELANIIISLINDKNKIKYLTEQGYKRYKDLFTSNIMTSNYSLLLRNN